MGVLTIGFRGSSFGLLRQSHARSGWHRMCYILSVREWLVLSVHGSVPFLAGPPAALADLKEDSGIQAMG